MQKRLNIGNSYRCTINLQLGHLPPLRKDTKVFSPTDNIDSDSHSCTKFENFENYQQTVSWVELVGALNSTKFRVRAFTLLVYTNLIDSYEAKSGLIQ